jgi:hypothetical protein
MHVVLPRFHTAGTAAAPIFVVVSLLAVLLCASAAGADTTAPDFGSPPSGEIPIIYNDRTVYAKPDLLKGERVLAAIARDGRIYVPLRSMFEQMGATVSVSADGKTVTAVKDQTSVSVTLGSDVVVINGETRPLDVPPILYQGVMLVPVRVLSEALDAYVQWVPSEHVVVVRYVPAPTPVVPPTEAPTAAPIVATPAPTSSPVPVPARRSYTVFVQAAIAAPKNYDEFSDGEFCHLSYVLSGAFAPENSPLAVKVDFREDVSVTSSNFTDQIGNQYTQFATIDGGTAIVPVFLARQSSLDLRLEYKVATPRIYVGVGYLQTGNNFGYPHLSALGAGVEKLPDLRSGINPFGSAFYYPTASGTYTVESPASTNFGTVYRQQYQVLKYDIGLAFVPGRSPVYLYGGFNGEQWTAKQNAPIGQTHNGPYIGLGVKL